MVIRRVERGEVEEEVDVEVEAGEDGIMVREGAKEEKAKKGMSQEENEEGEEAETGIATTEVAIAKKMATETKKEYTKTRKQADFLKTRSKQKCSCYNKNKVILN